MSQTKRLKVLTTIIVDDEEFARSSLYFLLQEHCSAIHICGIAKSVSEARTLLDTHSVDLIFLDIAMPVEDGFALIPQAQLHNASVIFTTAHDQYALKAIKANALDYLLKPIDIDELKQAVEKANLQHELFTASRNEGLTNLTEDLAATEISRLALPTGHGYRFVAIGDIVYINADSNYSIFHLANNEKITVGKVLKEYEELLPTHQFARVHKSSLVNLAYVTEYQTKNSLTLGLSNGDNIAVSRRRASDLFEKIKLYAVNESRK